MQTLIHRETQNRRNRILAPFLTGQEQENFHQQQADSGALISGSAALQFFNGERYHDSDLDVYVSISAAFPILSSLLFVGYGLSVPSTLGQDTLQCTTDPDSLAHQIIYSAKQGRFHGNYRMENWTILSVLNLTRGSALIQLILTKGPPMLAVTSFSACMSRIR